VSVARAERDKNYRRKEKNEGARRCGKECQCDWDA
jgi:hypothetical protein